MDDPDHPSVAENMHLLLDKRPAASLTGLSSLIDTAGLAEIDPYNDTVWSPDEATAMIDRLQELYDSVETLWPPKARTASGRWKA